MPALAGLPILIVTAEASAERLHFPDRGLQGNGHGLVYEMNSDAALAPALDWMIRKTEE